MPILLEMSFVVRRVCSVALVVVGGLAVAWVGSSGGMTDYPTLFAQPMNLLLGGHLGGFLGHLPADGAGGALLLQAPFALAGKLLFANQLTASRFGAAACVFVAGFVALWVASQTERSLFERVAIVIVCLSAPLALDAIHFGHPEEVLGAALSIAAVLLASTKPLIAGVVLGLAVITKPWAVLALGPALLATHGHRLKLCLAGAVVVGAWTTCQLVWSPDSFRRTLTGSADAVSAHPTDVWWPLARFQTRSVSSPLWQAVAGHGPIGSYFPPSWLMKRGHELMLLFAALITVFAARRGTRGVAGALALLAVLLVARCLLDPSNFVYYEVPAVMSVLAWETAAGRRIVIAPAYLAALWLIFHCIDSLSGQYVAYLVVTVPVMWLLLGAALQRTRSKQQVGQTSASVKGHASAADIAVARAIRC